MSLRRVTPIRMPFDVDDLLAVTETLPYIQEVPPFELYVDEEYQRNLSERSLKLISGMVKHWSWSKFKIPNVTKIDNKFYVVDGQHTAIAAVTRGFLSIPVLVTEGMSRQKQAAAFVGINQDRLAVTPIQLFKASVASGDVHAVGLQKLMDEFRINLLATPKGEYEVGDTMAISSFRKLYNTRSPVQAKMVLEVVTGANLAPIPAIFLKAVNDILWDKKTAKTLEKRGLTVTAYGLTTVIRSKPQSDWESMAISLSKRRGISGQEALVEVLLDGCAELS